WAFLDRMVVFTFANAIKKSKKVIDNFAENVLYPELPGILNWAIKGAMDWYPHRFTIPVSCRQAVDAIRTEKDRVAEFLATKATPNPVAVLKATVLWELYKEWY